MKTYIDSYENIKDYKLHKIYGLWVIIKEHTDSDICDFHKVFILDDFKMDMDWMYENINHHFSTLRRNYDRKREKYRTWYFEDEAEALLFKLRFG